MTDYDVDHDDVLPVKCSVEKRGTAGASNLHSDNDDKTNFVNHDCSCLTVKQ